MNEFDPTGREHINLSPLTRLDHDLAHVDTYADLYITLSRYFADEFNIPDYQVHLLLTPDEELLPSRDLFEQKSEIAREQARLVLIKMALPLAEFVIEDIEKFRAWLKGTAQVAMNIEHSNHRIDNCMKASRGTASHSCHCSQECPIKFTAYKLISDAAKVDKGSVEYSDAFIDAKIAKTVAKINIARDLGLFDEESAEMIARNYISRCHSR